MKEFTREDLRVARSPLVKVESEALGAVVYLRKISAQERSDYINSMSITKSDDPDKVMEADMSPGKLFDNTVRLVAMTLCDKDGNRFYTDSEEDLTEVRAIESDFLEMLFTKAIALNGMKGESAVAESLKNSGATQKSASTTV